MSVGLNPIGPWPVVAVFAAVVVFLTLWAYLPRLRTSTGGWRWLALGLRLAAVALCLFAALRPSLNLPEKKSQPAVVVLLLDRSSSLKIGDEVNGQTRWEVARKALGEAKKAIAEKSKDFETRVYQFDSEVREGEPDEKATPEGRESAYGSSLVDVVKRQATNVAMVVLFGDGANNAGLPPLVAAEQLRAKTVPVMTVGVGDENAGAGSKDVAVRDLVAGPTVFVKNQPEIRGTISARGFANKPIEVELLVEGEPGVVDSKTITPKTGAELIPVTGLKYLPQIPGEKRVTLRVRPQEGELVKSNNEFTSYLNVLKGGLKVVYLQGPNFTWELRYLVQGLDAAKEIHVDSRVVRRPAVGEQGFFEDALFAPGNYDVFILGDVAAEYFTTRQQRALASAVQRGAGLLMLGGRSSFGEGGWGSTPLAGVVPFVMRGGDGQNEPEGGLKFEPNPAGLQNFVLRVGTSPEDSRRIWEGMPNVSGTNRFGPLKPNALKLGEVKGTGEPMMVAMETGGGRVIAFGGETYTWSRGDDPSPLAYRRFWRQAILWLAHKEDQGESEIKLKIDRRRIALGQKLDLTATARDPKKEPIPDVSFQTTITRLDAPDPTRPDLARPEPVQLFPQGDEAKGFYFAQGDAGEYKVEVVGMKGGKEIGRDSARFNVYLDDRELENPAADRELLRQISLLTGGKSVTPEGLGKELASLDAGLTERVSLTEKRLWDNWPFFLIFTTLLTLEWWLRKRKGWV